MPETLAQKIKAKYPGTYDDIPDAELEQRIKDLEARIGWLEEQVNPDMESMEEYFARMNQIEIPVEEPIW